MGGKVFDIGKTAWKSIKGALGWAATAFLVPLVAAKTGMPPAVAGSLVFGAGSALRQVAKHKWGLKGL